MITIGKTNRPHPDEWQSGTCRIFVGRPSKLGNPFKIGRDGDRNQVIEKYRVWLWQQIKSRGPAWEELKRLKQLLLQKQSLVLTCYCFPHRCHAEVIRSCLHWMVKTHN